MLDAAETIQRIFDKTCNIGINQPKIHWKATYIYTKYVTTNESEYE